MKTIDDLKEEQDAFNDRKHKLINVFRPFRDTLIEILDRFILKALDKNIKGVSKISIVNSTEHIAEYSFKINNMDLLLISTNDVYPVSWENEFLSARQFIYDASDENNIPIFEIAVQESIDKPDSFIYHVKLTEEGQTKPALTGALNENIPQKITEVILDHFYNLRTRWKKNPTINDRRERDGSRITKGLHKIY